MKEIKITKKLIEDLKPFYERAKIAEKNFYEDIIKIEEQIKKITGLDVELFMRDNEIVGIRNYSRTMRLIQGKELT